jgi:hypothetical protein
MRGRFGRRSTQRSEGMKALLGDLQKARGRFGRQATKQAQPNYGVAVGLGVSALALLTTMAVLLLLRRRAARQGGSTEEVNIEPEETAG